LKVKRTLHQIYEELKHLREMKDRAGGMIAFASMSENKQAIEQYKDEYKHFDEVIKYLSHIEVEYDDKYETEEE
jgi:hypothetical protein